MEFPENYRIAFIDLTMKVAGQCFENGQFYVMLDVKTKIRRLSRVYSYIKALACCAFRKQFVWPEIKRI